MEERREPLSFFLRALFFPEKLSNAPSLTYNDEQVMRRHLFWKWSLLWSGLLGIPALQVGWHGEKTQKVRCRDETWKSRNGQSPGRLRNTLVRVRAECPVLAPACLGKKDRKKAVLKLAFLLLGKSDSFPTATSLRKIGGGERETNPSMHHYLLWWMTFPWGFA